MNVIKNWMDKDGFYLCKCTQLFTAKKQMMCCKNYNIKKKAKNLQRYEI